MTEEDKVYRFEVIEGVIDTLKMEGPEGTLFEIEPKYAFICDSGGDYVYIPFEDFRRAAYGIVMSEMEISIANLDAPDTAEGEEGEG